MFACALDHLTITAASLKAGADVVRQTLGVTPDSGGKHPRMGTHNLLLRLGESLFLEIIATDPKAPSPGQPRWFDLDRFQADAAPKLAAWVVRTVDIDAVSGGATEPLGDIATMTRGALNWRITIPTDGSVPMDGAAPALIQWQTAVHPAATLTDHGLSLARLDLFHSEPARVVRLLDSINFSGTVSVSPLAPGMRAYLVAHIQTPQGLRTLS